MTQEEKQILIKDLCARLPYGVICDMWFERNESDKITEVLKCGGLMRLMNSEFNFIVKPYLRPMSSMTEEEVKEIRKINWQFWKPKNDSDECFVGDADDGYCSVSQMAHIINYLNAHHFDYLGLIPMDVALEAKEGMYKM